MIVPQSAHVALLFAIAASAAVQAQDAPVSSSNAAPVSSSTVAPAEPAASVASSSSSSAAPVQASTSAPTSSANPSMSASSNFTLPAGATTATWPSGRAVPSSVPYNMQIMNLANLSIPAYEYSLASEGSSMRQALCDRQTSWCSTAGCAEAGATVTENFCETDTLASRCTCSKGKSNLNQYNWPVQMADCQNRASACTQACWAQGVSSNHQQCISNCNSILRNSCSTPGQISANYAVSKRGQSPPLGLMQGGDASGALKTLQGRQVGVVLGFAVVAVTLAVQWI